MNVKFHINYVCKILYKSFKIYLFRPSRIPRKINN